MSSNLKPIDFNHLDGIVNGDENFKKELIGIFLEQIPDFIKNMRIFLEKENSEKLAREAHTAKSSAMIFGMTNTGKLLKEIQLLAENKKTEEIIPLMEQVESEFESANVQLIEYLNR
jgi:HPt (histidine-containing phosphotransfer) domain-containing protein